MFAYQYCVAALFQAYILRHESSPGSQGSVVDVGYRAKLLPLVSDDKQQLTIDKSHNYDCYWVVAGMNLSVMYI